MPIKYVSYLLIVLSFLSQNRPIIEVNRNRYSLGKSHVEPAGLQYPPAYPQNYPIVPKCSHVLHTSLIDIKPNSCGNDLGIPIVL
ncbi:hypothetical protein ACN38_g3936 [Penicillium nordicum]|uniref:Uncharacterized protein n=1 Tax=Penicillium nordicum TaxID=229535 RepID=A0A0M8PBG2_9EURO|nr:hypothetical protein ACN38_g3936 [Penicillium nordicum]